MAKERLSKLQKWILITGEKQKGQISKRKIYHGFWGEEKVHADCLEWHKYHPPYLRGKCIGEKFRVSLNRSLTRLRQKDLVHFYGRRDILITDKGLEKAKSLMLPCVAVNNKKGSRNW